MRRGQWMMVTMPVRSICSFFRFGVVRLEGKGFVLWSSL